MTEERKAELLETFIKEFFAFDELVLVGFFKEEMRNDYEAQAKRICSYFGFESVYEYGNIEVKAHLSYVGERPKDEPFVTVIESIY